MVLETDVCPFYFKKILLKSFSLLQSFCGLTWYHEPIIIMLFFSEKCKIEIAKNAK